MPYYAENNTITHSHHVVPKHISGIDDTSNLKEMAVQNHAEKHKWLFIEHGHAEEALAWLGLYGFYECRKNTAQITRLGKKHTEHSKRLYRAVDIWDWIHIGRDLC